MNMSNQEIQFLMMIADVVDEYLKHPVMIDPRKSQIVPRMERILPRFRGTDHRQSGKEQLHLKRKPDSGYQRSICYEYPSRH